MGGLHVLFKLLHYSNVYLQFNLEHVIFETTCTYILINLRNILKWEVEKSENLV